MKQARTCPRCDSPVHEPNAWSSAWHCDLHGEVDPLRPAQSPSREGLDALLKMAAVPVWLPWPLPPGWLVAGFTGAGDERTGLRASVAALSGPNVAGGPADFLLVAEEPGVGLGARFAGLPGPDPGLDFLGAKPQAAVRYGNHEFPLWHIEAPDRAAYVGEVMAHWLWLVLWPAAAGLLLMDVITLRDLRDPWQDLDLPFGALSPQLPS